MLPHATSNKMLNNAVGGTITCVTANELLLIGLLQLLWNQVAESFHKRLEIQSSIRHASSSCSLSSFLTHSPFHSTLKTSLFQKSSLTQTSSPTHRTYFTDSDHFARRFLPLSSKYPWRSQHVYRSSGRPLTVIWRDAISLYLLGIWMCNLT